MGDVTEILRVAGCKSRGGKEVSRGKTEEETIMMDYPTDVDGTLRECL